MALEVESSGALGYPLQAKVSQDEECTYISIYVRKERQTSHSAAVSRARKLFNTKYEAHDATKRRH